MLGFRALSTGPISEIRHAIVAETTTTTVRFASSPFTTRPTDTPANQTIQGRIGAGLRLERRLAQTDGGQFGSLLQTEFGEIQLGNSDGALDYLATRHAADGRQIRLKIGGTEFLPDGREQKKPFADFATVYIATGGVWTFEHNALRLRIVDMASRLQSRLQIETYAGTGGSNGTAEITGITRPLIFGRASNVTAQLVDPAILTYQVNTGTTQLIAQVYDAGVVVPFSADYPTYAALAGATLPVPPQVYASCLAEGYIRLAISPIGAVTANVRGHKDSVSGSYIETTAAVIRTILGDFGDIPTAEVDLPAFTAATSLQPGAIGLALPAGDQSTIIEVIERLAFAAGFFIGDRSGKFTIQRLSPPVPTTVHWAFTDRDMINIERLTMPYEVPWKSWGVGYDVNWTKQTDAELATGVTQDRRIYVKEERRYAYANSSDIALFHATSSGAPLRDSFFADAAVADAEAQRLIELYSYGRALYDAVVKNALFSVHVGQTVRLTYRRWDLSGGKDFIVVGVADDADRVRDDFTALWLDDKSPALYVHQSCRCFFHNWPSLSRVPAAFQSEG